MRCSRNAFSFTLSALIAVLLCDAYLQLAEIQTPMETTIDPVLGPTFIPGRRIIRLNEGFFLGEVNDFGYMGPSVPPHRRGAERRILLLGDSFVLGHTVLPRHHFARRLEQSLTEVVGETVHVLNFGKAGFDIRDMYVYFSSYVAGFDHDLALFFVEENDLIPAGRLASELYPVVRLAVDAPLIDTSFRESKKYRFYRAIEPVTTRSAVLRLAFNAYKMVQRGELEGLLLGKFAQLADATPDAAGPPPAVSAGRAPVASLPPLSRAILCALARDPRNVLVIQNDLPSALREEVLRVGLPVLELSTELAALKTGGQDPYYWPVTKLRGHWNHATHGEIARFLERELVRKRLLWPCGRPPSSRSSYD